MLQLRSFRLGGDSKHIPIIRCNAFLATLFEEQIVKVEVLPPGKNDCSEPSYVVVYRVRDIPGELSEDVK